MLDLPTRVRLGTVRTPAGVLPGPGASPQPPWGRRPPRGGCPGGGGGQGPLATQLSLSPEGLGLAPTTCRRGQPLGFRPVGFPPTLRYSCQH